MLDETQHTKRIKLTPHQRMIGWAVVVTILLTLLPAVDQGVQRVLQALSSDTVPGGIAGTQRAVPGTAILASNDGYATRMADRQRLTKKMPLPKGPKSHKYYEPLISRAAQRYAVDPELISAIIMAESNFNPQAVSYRGAQGLMQLMPATARSLGVEDSFNPEHNIDGGVRYFKRLMNRFDGNTRLALAAYNAGSTKVRRYNGVPPFKQTQTYVRKVLAYYQAFKSEGRPDDRA